MASRPNRRTNGNAIRGPQSALTDYLAANQISAQQINLDYQNRVRQAQQQEENDAASAVAEGQQSDGGEDPAERRKRKRKEEKAIAAIKASKEFKKRKFDHRQKEGSGAESNDDALAREMLNKPKGKAPPKPGQLANCEVCEKRFTVTPYTLGGQNGGLLCTKCGKDFKTDQKKLENAAKKARKPVQRARKRQQESNRMMGDVKPGARSLVEQCVRKVADVVNDIEEFGDLPQRLLDRLSQILSLKRVLTPRTLNLFLQPDIDRIAVYDCGRLETEDFSRIFAFMPNVERVNLRFAGQFKDENIRYMIEKCRQIKHLQLGASNLLSNPAWIELFETLGPQLESLKLSELNNSLDDEVVQQLTQHCAKLERLKLRGCTHMTSASVPYLKELKRLEHLTLAVGQDCQPEILVDLITSLGPNLKTLCLEDFHEADDTVLQAVRAHCRSLAKLRLTGNANYTDQAFKELFTEWPNAPLSFVDLSSNRDLDSSSLDADIDCPLGFASAAMVALMGHSGQSINTLDLHSNRHINHEALTRVFAGEQQYPELRKVDLSFVTHVNDVVIDGIFQSCPNLEKLAVFACFQAQQVTIPSGIAVIGLPNAQAAVVLKGNSH